MLLFKSNTGGKEAPADLTDRHQRFLRGDWAHLLARARDAAVTTGATGGDDLASRRARALRRVRLGELSHARQQLTAAALAPGNEETFQSLTDPDRPSTA